MEDGIARASPRWRIAILAGAGLMTLAFAIAWSERKPIAAGFVDRALAERGVKGSYRIVELGLRHQFLENVRIGDPASPDLTADAVELTLAYGLHGPEVRAIGARGVRLRGRLIDGRVSFGAVDRLLPKPSGEPFALPDYAVDVTDARMRLDTPAGPIGLSLDGSGRLSDGFRGRLAAVSHGLTLAGCRLAGASAVVNLAIEDRKPALDGPVRIAAVSCGGVGLVDLRAEVDTTLGNGLDSWRGSAAVSIGAVRQAAASAEQLAGRVGFSGDARRTRGAIRLASGPLIASNAHAASARIDGAYAVDGIHGGLAFVGAVRLNHAAAPLPFPTLSAIAGTPIAPLADALTLASRRAAADAEIDGRIALAARGGKLAARLSQLTVSGASGARATVTGGDGLAFFWPSRAMRLGGTIAISGGGFPEARLTLRQSQANGSISGEAMVAPYAAGGARIALAPVTFAVLGEQSRFATRVTLDGPLAGGRVVGLSLPLAGRVSPDGGFALNPGCAPLGFTSLEVAGAHFDATRLTLCPTGGALVMRARGRLSGGGAIVSPRLAGRSGGAPLEAIADLFRFELAEPGFGIDALRVRLGVEPRQTRLDVASLAGTVGKTGLSGRFAGAAGQIGAVPLLLSRGEGGWRLAGGTLALDATLQVADSAATPRFRPLLGDDVRLALVGGVVTATGTLREPRSRAQVAAVALHHDLSSGKGGATLDVPELRFDERLQPEALTPLTVGVVANVEGALSGKGAIAWTADGVTSSGRFRTDGIDLAAAFGSVSGIKSEIVFTDLLGLETAPGQVATIAEVNPGIVVANGVVHYQLLAGQRVRIEDGEWPFSGGKLVMRPTVMDFGQPIARNLVFALDGLDAARFVQQLAFENIAATGTFDGTIPMVFDDKGGRIEDGRLVARAGGGTLAYVGVVTKAQLGVFGKLAFDALKSIRYKALSIDLDGALDGEIVSRVQFNGVNQQPLTKDTPFVKTMQRLPFKFNILIHAPFRGLVGSARSFADPTLLIRDFTEVPAAATAGQPPIQPSESETKP